MVHSYLTFLKELPKKYEEIGGLIPSSPALGRAMVRPIRESRKKSLNILEVGPGTGPFTRQILKLMGHKDRLTICEINPRFVKQLQTELPKNKHFLLHQERVELFEGPVQGLAKQIAEPCFDVVVSSLPFSNFPPDMVDEILQCLKAMLVPDGVITFCEYVGVRKLAGLLPDRRARVKGVDAVIKKWCTNVRTAGRVKKEIALLNFPPAYTIHFSYGNGNFQSHINGKNGLNGHARTNGSHSNRTP